MTIKTPALNFLLAIAGLLIIWLSTHNWIAILGGIIGATHVEYKLTNK